MCMAEPQCRVFIAQSLCCIDAGILLHASVKLWLVCDVDVYLPEPKCLTVSDRITNLPIPPLDPTNPQSSPLNTVNVSILDTPNARAQEFRVDLPLAYFVPPIMVDSPGQLPLVLDFEAARMAEADGLCSLRLRAPCEWEGVVYEAVTAVGAVNVTSVLSANETEVAEALVQEVLNQANNMTPPPPPPIAVPSPAPGPLDAPAEPPAVGPEGMPTGAPDPIAAPGPTPDFVVAEAPQSFEPPRAPTGAPDLISGAPVAAPSPALDLLSPPVPPLASGPAGAPSPPPGAGQAPLVAPAPELPASPAPSPLLPQGPSPTAAPGPEVLLPYPSPYLSFPPEVLPEPSPYLSLSPPAVAAPVAAPPPGDFGVAGDPAPPTPAVPGFVDELPAAPDAAPGAPAAAPDAGAPAPAPAALVGPLPPSPPSQLIVGIVVAPPSPPARGVPTFVETVPAAPSTAPAPAPAPGLAETQLQAAGLGRRLMSLAAGGLGRWRGGRKLKGDLLTAGGGVMPDPLQMAAAAAERRSLVEDAATAQDPAFDFSAPVAEPVPVRALTAVGAELPVPQVDPATLPPLTNVLGPLEADLLVEDYFISWLPTNSSSGELCQMTSAGELPEAFLLGDFQDLVGYEEDCTPETLPEVGGGELVAF